MEHTVRGPGCKTKRQGSVKIKLGFLQKFPSQSLAATRKIHDPACHAVKQYTQAGSVKPKIRQEFSSCTSLTQALWKVVGIVGLFVRYQRHSGWGLRQCSSARTIRPSLSGKLRHFCFDYLFPGGASAISRRAAHGSRCTGLQCRGSPELSVCTVHICSNRRSQRDSVSCRPPQQRHQALRSFSATQVAQGCSFASDPPDVVHELEARVDFQCTRRQVKEKPGVRLDLQMPARQRVSIA